MVAVRELMNFSGGHAGFCYPSELWASCSSVAYVSTVTVREE